VLPLQKRLFAYGIDGFLSIQTQKTDDSPKTQFLDQAKLLNTFKPYELDFNGSCGLYFKELFFQIPFLIADHLNNEGKYKDADYWFRKIFDPSAPLDSFVSDKKDRYWQYLEFRDQKIPKLLEILRNQAAISKYEKDPFNPHAIARLRTSAYMKSIVMKYVDNLLDWADSLFRKDTFEDNAEALMLYMLAHDILGPRPQKKGKCESAVETENCGCATPVTYANLIKDSGGSPFLYYVENLLLTPADELDGNVVVFDQSGTGFGGSVLGGTVIGYEDQTASEVFGGGIQGKDTTAPAPLQRVGESPLTSHGYQLSQRMNRKNVFCVPNNKKMLDYWDRLDDRLYKLRHCMNIDGVKRTLSLFQPEIDPALLVLAKAGGLDLADIVGGLYAPPPAYRFTYLLEKARAFAGTVQGFGGALLSALEKKDGEQLTLLRSTHEQNLLKMTRELKKKAVAEAEANLQAAAEGMVNTMNRIVQYTLWIDENLNGWERTQQISLHTSSTLSAIEPVFNTIASISALIVNVGAPTAMTFGGKQLTGASENAARIINSLAHLASLISSSAGLEASFQRRAQDWKFQLKTAEQELKQVQQQITAATIRHAIAQKDLEIHEKQMEQAAEVHDFYKDKFTSLELYKVMSKELGSLHRQAYNVAVELANQAKAAYEFETGELFPEMMGSWDATRAGLLSGEGLSLQLQKMESAYLKWNVRQMEIRQSFSMMMLDPEQLLSLQTTGACTFKIPEWAFDVQYPGYYRRRIVSVQISVPCIAGPYTNVAATLTMLKGSLRNEALNANNAAGVFSYKGSNMVATSNAQNDGGQFDLNFRDERYLPFEGAGAVDSEWRLELPAQFRSFDYATIADVIFHISYRAKYDGGLFKTNVQNELILKIKTGLHVAINLKHDMPNEWHLLKQEHSAVLTIDASRLPYLAQEVLGASIDTVMFFSKSASNPASLTIDIDSDTTDLDTTSTPLALSRLDAWKMCRGTTAANAIVLGTPFKIAMSAAQVADLEALILVVKLAL
jgi:hypothetical protein